MSSNDTEVTHKSDRVKKRKYETITEESVEDEPLLSKGKTTGQVVFDPPYSLLKYPKKYKRDDMGILSGWLGCVIIAALVLGFCWISYFPNVPDWAGERFLLQCYTSGMRVAQLMSLPVPYLTFFKVGRHDALRWIFELFYTSHIPDNDVWVGITDAVFDNVPVKIFRPRSAVSDSPAIIYIHGGGWTFLSAESYTSTTYHMARKFNVVVVSIDYRLAPEHPYPAALEDCLKATAYFLRSAVKHDVNPNRIAVAGDSAGGNLAAAVALRLSKDKEYSHLPRLKFQVLVYPALQMLDFNTYSYNNFTSTAWLTKELMIYLWLSYLGFPELQQQIGEFAANNHTSQQLKESEYWSYLKHENLPEPLRVKAFQPVGLHTGNDTLFAKIESRILDPYFAPLLAADLTALPSAYMILAQNDVLRDDGLLYAKRLRAAGVDTKIDLHTTMAHGFCLISPVEALTFQGGVQAFNTLASYVQENL